MSKHLIEQLESMDRDALLAELSRAHEQIQVASRKDQETQQRLTDTRQELAQVTSELAEMIQENEMLKELLLLRSKLPFTPSTE